MPIYKISYPGLMDPGYDKQEMKIKFLDESNANSKQKENILKDDRTSYKQ